MARKTIFVSDFDKNREISDDKQHALITIKFSDGRRGQIVADAHVNDAIVKQITEAGRSQARRGRKPKAS
jgi:hypothetical protein